jgi:inner membrane protein
MHILGDLITSFGTMIFAPLSSTRVEWGTTFIIDLWLTGIIVAALVGAWIWRSSRIPGLIGIAVVLGYIGLQWQLGRQATEIGIAYVHAQAIPAARVRALPRPVSPFNWMIIVTEPDRYHYANVNLRRKQPLAQGPEAGFVRRLDMHYLPIERLRWQTLPKFGDGAARAFSEEAWRQDEFAFYRWFAAYPLVAEVSRENGADCVWFRDLRFLTPGRESWPFRYGMCREPGGAWHAYSYPEGGSALRVR